MSQDHFKLLWLDTNVWVSIGALATVIYMVFTIGIFRVVILQWRATQEQIKQSARQNAWNDLFATASRMNDYIATHGEKVKQAGLQEPYDPASGQPAFQFLLHHIDFIYRYWLYKEHLKEDERKGFEHWIDAVFFSWLAKNKEKLLVDYEVVMNRKDLYSEDFLRWLKAQQHKSIFLKSASSQ